MTFKYQEEMKQYQSCYLDKYLFEMRKGDYGENSKYYFSKTTG